jgi:Xaa-Pro dipeptidase
VSSTATSIDPEHYRFRQQKVCGYLAEREIQVGVIVDQEGIRNRSLRYLCGQPMDALLFLFAEGMCLLVPWDVPLAESLATVDELIPYETFSRSLFTAIRGVLEERSIRRAELSAALPFPLVEALKSVLPAVRIVCKHGGIDDAINVMRMVKDSEEIALLRRACAITDVLIQAVPGFVGKHPEVTELELALFLEAQARRRGAEGMGFDTVAASPSRSHAIHSVPNFGSMPIATQGLSILDFGVCVAGYTSDVTLTLIRGPLSEKQKAMIEAVQSAYELAQSLCKPGADPAILGEDVQVFFEQRGFHMPHSLGHGIGLDAHERPSFRRASPVGNTGAQNLLQPGMVFTLEPGLYDPQEGGVRLENDFLCTESGVEILTSAETLYL